jgi:hypothetical protein
MKGNGRYVLEDLKERQVVLTSALATRCGCQLLRGGDGDQRAWIGTDLHWG